MSNNMETNKLNFSETENKQVRKCTVCRQQGHNIRTCPDRKFEEKCPELKTLNKKLDQQEEELVSQVEETIYGPLDCKEQRRTRRRTSPSSRRCGVCQEKGHNRRNCPVVKSTFGDLTDRIGKVFYTGNIRFGQPSGKGTIFHSNGKPYLVGRCRPSIQGVRPRSALDCEMTDLEGEIWDDSGSLFYKGNIVDGQPHGTGTSFHPNGRQSPQAAPLQIKNHGSFLHGKPSDECKSFDEKGLLITDSDLTIKRYLVKFQVTGSFHEEWKYCSGVDEDDILELKEEDNEFETREVIRSRVENVNVFAFVETHSGYCKQTCPDVDFSLHFEPVEILVGVNKEELNLQLENQVRKENQFMSVEDEMSILKLLSVRE